MLLACCEHMLCTPSVAELMHGADRMWDTCAGHIPRVAAAPAAWKVGQQRSHPLPKPQEASQQACQASGLALSPCGLPLQQPAGPSTHSWATGFLPAAQEHGTTGSLQQGPLQGERF